MPNLTLDDWIHDLERRHAIEIQLGLPRVCEVAQRLELLSPQCKVITIAGTNGKGSTVAALESIYSAADYQVASYTSPHLMQFNERIRVNLAPISDADLCRALEQIEAARDTTKLTYFEMVTLAALWHFNQLTLDVMILEVGLGGRQDATNIIDADLSIITTIDFDHQAYLGDTLDAIGYEKAGIMRSGQLSIFADTHLPATIKFEAEKLGVQHHCLGTTYYIEDKGESWVLKFKDEIFELPQPHLQLKSAAAAVLATQLLKNTLPVCLGNLSKGMDTAFVPGRLQLIPGKISWLFDVAHNPQASRLLAKQIKKIENKSQVHVIFSALKDKDLPALIEPLKDCVHHWYPAQLNVERAATSLSILNAFETLDMNVSYCYQNLSQALNQVELIAAEGDLIVVYGSFYTVSYILNQKGLS